MPRKTVRPVRRSRKPKGILHRPGLIISIVVFAVLVLGVGAGAFLALSNQDLRNQAAGSQNQGGITKPKPVWRYHNTKADTKGAPSHLFTLSEQEMDNLKQWPWWQKEGIAFYAYDRPVPGAKPVTRYRYEEGHDYGFAITDAQRAYFQNKGWIREGDMFYAFDTNFPGTVQVHYLENPDGNQMHLWTINQDEINTVKSWGWIDHGNQFRAFASPADAPNYRLDTSKPHHISFQTGNLLLQAKDIQFAYESSGNRSRPIAVLLESSEVKQYEQLKDNYHQLVRLKWMNNNSEADILIRFHGKESNNKYWLQAVGVETDDFKIYTDGTFPPKGRVIYANEPFHVNAAGNKINVGQPHHYGDVEFKLKKQGSNEVFGTLYFKGLHVQAFK